MLTLMIATMGLAQANDVVLPEFSAGSLTDFEAAEQVTLTVQRAMQTAGLSVDGPDLLVAAHPDIAIGCAETPGCPVAILARTGDRIAVIGNVSVDGPAWSVTVQFYRPGELEPVQTLKRTTSSQSLLDFADEVPPVVQALIGEMRQSEEVGKPGRVRVVVTNGDGDIYINGEPRGQANNAEPYVLDPGTHTVEIRAEGMLPLKESFSVASGERLELNYVLELAPIIHPTEAELADKRLQALPRQAQERFAASGLDLETWLDESQIRTRRVYVEALGGIGFGDVTRRYDTRVSVRETDSGGFEQSLPYEYEAFIQGVGGSGALAISYAPLWWLDTSLVGGIVITEKELSAGWEQLNTAGDLVDENTVVYDPVSSVMGIIEPRLRLFFVATGPVKPYAMGGGHLRLFDGYVVPDVGDDINYADRQGDYGLGVTAGGGLAFEAQSRLTGFIEVPWTYLFQPEPYLQQGENLITTPNRAPGSKQLVQFRAGIGFKL